MSLAQIGEFSFIIAALGLSLGAVPDFLYPVAVAVSALTTLTTPWFIRASGPVASWVDRKLPHSLQTYLALYGTWIAELRAPGRRKSRAQRLVRLLVLDLVLLTGVVIATAQLFEPAAGWARVRLGLDQTASQALVAAVSLALAAPFIVGIVRLVGALALALSAQALPGGGEGKVDLAAAPRRALIVSLQLAAAVALGLPFFTVTRAFLPLGVTAAAFGLALLILGARLWRSVAQLQGHVRAGAEVLVEAFSQAVPDAATSAEEERVHHVLPGLGSPVRFTLRARSPAIGRTLANLNLRGATGATVLAISRSGQRVLVPTGHEQLHVNDVLALAGTKEAVDGARALLSGEPAAPDPGAA
jgi:CPA2 family monovalent cation:H+ antiporter-2